MSKRMWSISGLIVTLFVVSAACNLPFNKGNNDKTSSPGENGNNAVATEPNLPGVLNPLASAPDSKPVSFQEGLGSLDSYRFNLSVKMSDSSGSVTSIDEMVESSVIDENNHSTMTSTSRSPEDTEDSVSTSETYNLGTVTCTYDGEEWSYSKKSEQDKEISDLFSQMIDFVPVIKNPEFVGKEEINGVKANHFTFKISGIGEKSGAVATQNQGDYWLAVDGQYILKYTLLLQIQSAPEGSSEANTSIMDIKYELYDVNVPILLTQPVDCVPTVE
jgi:hypothetical protein